MSDRPSSHKGALDIDLARRIDEICLRFEAAWREGRQPRIDDYLVDVLDQGRPALRAELSHWSASSAGRKRPCRAPRPTRT